jgi:hypothetical protein
MALRFAGMLFWLTGVVDWKMEIMAMFFAAGF